MLRQLNQILLIQALRTGLDGEEAEEEDMYKDKGEAEAEAEADGGKKSACVLTILILTFLKTKHQITKVSS